jgi:hypothetical protein
MAPITKLMKKIGIFIWTIECQEAWDLIKLYGSIDSNTLKLVFGIPCAHRCIIVGSRCNVGTKPKLVSMTSLYYTPLDYSIKKIKIILKRSFNNGLCYT